MTVKASARYVSNHDFTIFAWYRIVFGIFVLLTAYFGWVRVGGPLIIYLHGFCSSPASWKSQLLAEVHGADAAWPRMLRLPATVAGSGRGRRQR